MLVFTKEQNACDLLTRSPSSRLHDDFIGRKVLFGMLTGYFHARATDSPATGQNQPRAHQHTL